MASDYPAQIDRFSEPVQPQSTALNQSGQTAAVGAPKTRNHYEHHRDLGDVVEALQENASQTTHDHSGDTADPKAGGKLDVANTHENVDPTTDVLHHQLGSSAWQAAPGNHTHDYESGTIVNAPFVRCLSTNHPGDPGNDTPRTEGLNIYETDTNRMRVWANFGTGNGLRWNILPTANIPIVRLAQKTAQTLSPGGTTITWDDELEDNFAYFPAPASNSDKTTLTVTEPGVYQIDLALQWSTQFVPDLVTVVVCVNGEETPLRYSSLQRSGILSSIFATINKDYSQTMAVSGKLRITPDKNRVSVKCRYTSGPFLGVINTYFDLASNVRSRLEMHYVGP